MAKTIFSGVQPSGNLHIGNYIGALSQWKKVQDEADCFFCIVDLHAITVPQDPKVLREKILEVAALYIASGIDPKKAHIFVQSENPDHTNLAWILNCISSMGQLRRMTQFKDKAKKQVELLSKIPNEFFRNAESISLDNEKAIEQENQMADILDNVSSVGLFDYPVLMASDILLYGTDEVPVGEDQKQHIELTRDLAEKFNKTYGQVFKLPEPVIQKETPLRQGYAGQARIMSLQNPNAKMSKSDKDPMGVINLLDDKETVRNKVMKAVTDSEGSVKASPEKPAVTNLLTIYSSVSGKRVEELEQEFQGKGYGDFKTGLVTSTIEFLKPLQQKYQELRSNDEELNKILDEGRDYAIAHSSPTLQRVKELVGLGRA